VAFLCPVRPTVLIASLLLAAAPAFAAPKEPASQQPETKAEPEHSHLEDLSHPDPNKTFEIDKAFAHRNVPGTFQSSKNNTPKEFYFQQKFTSKGYETKDFGGKKSSWFGNFKFGTKDAPLYSRNEIPNAGKAAAVKTAPTKDAREASKTAPVRELADAHRPYLGKEMAKMSTGINPNDPSGPRTTNDLRELKTIDDVKALLNKN
jgi:hypothetical protein